MGEDLKRKKVLIVDDDASIGRLLERILKKTLGVPIFQEQVMKLAAIKMEN